jgi:LuxR family transcriptional regulator, positive regulator of biofilm formation
MTKREYEIALLRIDGLKCNEIADRLNITQHTVDIHLFNLYRKLKVHNVAQLVKKLRTYTNNGYTTNDI